MKLNLADLEQAISWIKKNTSCVTVDVRVKTSYDNFVTITAQEPNGQEAEIKLFRVDKNEVGLRIPKITRTKDL